jgi:hypothetical protein
MILMNMTKHRLISPYRSIAAARPKKALSDTNQPLLT